MKHYFGAACTFAAFLSVCAGVAPAQTVVYNSIPSVVPPNVPSEGYQCCATAEFGDKVALAGTPRVAGFVTVLMSDWAKHSEWPTMPAAGFTHPITLNIYADATAALAHAPLGSVTQTVFVPWRPEADPTCAGGTAWRSPVDHLCYNGLAFTATFDLRTAGPGGGPLTLPNTLIYGVEYNTQTWGYHPIGVGGPYDSLNVGLNANSGPSVGTDVNPDGVYWNTSVAGFYTDGGAGGIGTFREDTAWTPYVPAAQITAFAFPTTMDDCKNGGWQQLVSKTFTPFKNQGACVSYVQAGK